jgi:hypothetical protein
MEENHMRKVMLLLGLFGLAGTIWAQDPSLGTWKLNLAKSKMPASETANVKETIIEMRELDANTYESISTVTRKDGSTQVTKWTVPKVGGIQTYQQGGPANEMSIVAAKIDPRTIYNIYLRNGIQVFLMQMKISKDGKTFTGTAKTTDPQGKPIDYLVIYDRQ